VALAAGFVSAQATQAAQVVDVRIGIHTDHTRVVIELDEPSGHQIDRLADGSEALSVRVEARGEPREVKSRSKLVKAVTLAPGDGGAVARIALREPGLEYSELLLGSPPRIVIDVRRAGVAAASPAPTPQAAAEPGAPLAAEPSPANSGDLPSERAPVPTLPADAASPEPAPTLAAANEAATHVLANPPRTAGVPPEVEALTAALRSGFEAAPAVLALAVLLLAWFAYRRLAIRRTRQRALDTWEEDLLFAGEHPEEPSVEAEVASEPALALEAAKEAEEPSALEATALAEVPRIVVPEPEATSGWQTLSVPPTVPRESVPTVPRESVPALEHRIARLEGRIEELLEARERLERYAAAQNEELRVQRAAIARTQRVLRGIVRTEDQPGELSPRPAPPAAPE
jgi:hypothetical protein